MDRKSGFGRNLKPRCDDAEEGADLGCAGPREGGLAEQHVERHAAHLCNLYGDEEGEDVGVEVGGAVGHLGEFVHQLKDVMGLSREKPSSAIVGGIGEGSSVAVEIIDRRNPHAVAEGEAQKRKSREDVLIPDVYKRVASRTASQHYTDHRFRRGLLLEILYKGIWIRVFTRDNVSEDHLLELNW